LKNLKNLKQKFKSIALGLFLATVVSSCSENEPNSTNSTVASEEKGVATQLGEKLDNPYSVANMKKALANLRKSKLNAKIIADDFEITTTHLYVKFTPKNEEELDLIKSDTTLVVYDYPLDYEVAVSGDYYRDPNISEDQPTPLYCSVKVDAQLVQGTGKVKSNAKVMENIEKTTLEELFIPDEEFDTEENGTTNKTANPAMRKINGKMVSVELIDALVEEALRITNNLDKPSTQNKTAKTASSKWRPAGRIRVWDDYFQDYVGVEGVQVRARRWFTTHRGWVGVDGYYSCDGRFKRPANYSIDWDRYEFALQDGWLNGATYNGPKKEGNWDLELKGDKQSYYATIFRAAHHYYYKDIKGLKRPPTNSFWKPKMRIRAHNSQNNDINGSHQKDLRIFGAFARIHIYNPQNSTSEIYGTTIHELAHASHWELRKNNWNDNNLEEKVKESWAVGVQWELTRMVHPNYRGRNWNTNQPSYTLVVADMIDGVGFNNTNFGFSDSRDGVSGYTIKQIEDVLSQTSSWNNWLTNIKNIHNNSTENNLDNLFKSYE
jgi:hypothetical protein